MSLSAADVERERKLFERHTVANGFTDGGIVKRRHDEPDKYLSVVVEYEWQSWLARASVPEGFVLVPIEPTEKMCKAVAFGSYLTTSYGGEDSFDYLSEENAAEIYRDMLSAAPRAEGL